MSVGSNLFFPWLLGPFYLIYVLVLVLFTLPTSITFTSFVLLSSNALLPPCTVLFSQYFYVLAWRITFVVMLQLHTNTNNIIVEWTAASRQPLPILLSFPSSLYVLVLWWSSCWNKKRNLWILSGKYFINFPRKYDYFKLFFKLPKYMHIIHTNWIRKWIGHS